MKKLIFLLLVINTAYLNSMQMSNFVTEFSHSKKIFALSVYSILGYNMLYKFISYRVSPYTVDKSMLKKSLSSFNAAMKGFHDSVLPSLLIGSLVVGASRLSSLPKLEFSDVIKPGLVTFDIITGLSLFDGCRKALYYNHEEMTKESNDSNNQEKTFKTFLRDLGEEKSKRLFAVAFADNSKRFWGTIGRCWIAIMPLCNTI